MDTAKSHEDQRRAELQEALAEMSSHAGLGLTVDVEDQHLLADAMTCYIHGANSGAIFCVHAACERDLAADLQHTEAPPRRSEMWGLGPLVSHFRDEGAMPEDLLDRLDILNDHRKSLYHYGHTESETALLQRTHDLIEREGSDKVRRDYREEHGHDGRDKEVLSFALERVTRETALSALTTALMLRSWIAANQGL